MLKVYVYIHLYKNIVYIMCKTYNMHSQNKIFIIISFGVENKSSQGTITGYYWL